MSNDNKITSAQYLASLRKTNVSGLFSEHEIIAYGILCRDEADNQPQPAPDHKSAEEVYKEKEAKRVLKNQVEDILFSAYLTGKDFDRTGRIFHSWKKENKVAERLIELISNHAQFQLKIVMPGKIEVLEYATNFVRNEPNPAKGFYVTQFKMTFVAGVNYCIAKIKELNHIK